MTPQQSAAQDIHDCIMANTDSFVMPTFGRMAKWHSDYTAPWVCAVVVDLGSSLDGKSGNYLQSILRDRHAAGWQPSGNGKPKNTISYAHYLVIAGEVGRWRADIAHVYESGGESYRNAFLRRFGMTWDQWAKHQEKFAGAIA